MEAPNGGAVSAPLPWQLANLTIGDNSILDVLGEMSALIFY